VTRTESECEDPEHYHNLKGRGSQKRQIGGRGRGVRYMLKGGNVKGSRSSLVTMEMGGASIGREGESLPKKPAGRGKVQAARTPSKGGKRGLDVFFSFQSKKEESQGEN